MFNSTLFLGIFEFFFFVRGKLKKKNRTLKKNSARKTFEKKSIESERIAVFSY